MNQIQISKMCMDDLQGVYDVEKSSFPIPWSISSLEEEMKNMLATYLVAKIDNKIVGYIGMWFVMDECHITNIAVLEEYRRNGIGKQLVNELLKNCKEHGTTYIQLEVRKANIPAQKLYESFGFKIDFNRKNYYKNPDGSHEDAYVMIKNI